MSSHPAPWVGPLVCSLVILALTAVTGCSSVPARAPAEPIRRPADTGHGVTVPPGPSSPSGIPATAGRVVSTARSLLATPYRYGGADPDGFDCSGLVTFLFLQAGLALPRNAEQQATAGHWVAPDELRPGDLLFFGDVRSKPYHVGVVSSRSGAPLTMIHASTSHGVVETQVTNNPYWLPRLRFGRRVLPR